MSQFEGPYSMKSVDGLKTPVYIFLPGGERKDIGEATITVDGGMSFDVQLDDEHKDIETAAFNVPMRFTYLNLPDKPFVNWTWNCLTDGIHNGRPEAIWKLSLIQTTYMFTPAQLQQLVVDRIYNDAMQIAEHSDNPSMFEKWAEKTKEIAGPMVLEIYQRKVAEITEYYRSRMFKGDLDMAIELNKNNKLNPRYEPSHGHDTLNLLCRIVGDSAKRQASAELEKETRGE